MAYVGGASVELYEYIFWSDSEFTYVYEQGRLGGTIFQIGARHTPGTDDIASFAVVLFFELADGTRVEVAKTDDTEHEGGNIHIDRYYGDVGTDDKDFDVDIDDAWEAEDHLRRNCEHFARTYLENHGREPRNA